jgi:Domain of unknown function (DUF5664)
VCWAASSRLSKPKAATRQKEGTVEGKDTNPKDAIAMNKLPLHLVSSIVKAYQAIAHFLGNVKYGAWNYRGAGIRYSVYKSALERHLDAWWEGEENDPTDGTPHLANAQACLNILIEGKYTSSTIDDRPPSRAEALAKIRAELEALMPKIRERYADKDPKHWTIADSADSAALACGWVNLGSPGKGVPTGISGRDLASVRLQNGEEPNPSGCEVRHWYWGDCGERTIVAYKIIKVADQ